MPDAPLAAPSPAALRLGVAGLLPFVLGAVWVWTSRDAMQAQALAALAAYGAVIVSFLGGIHWGLAFRQAAPRRALLVWGVVPSLLAWAALALPFAPGLAWLGAALIACYLVDRRVYADEGLAAWLPLRRRLTVVASVCCFLGAAGAAL